MKESQAIARLPSPAMSTLMVDGDCVHVRLSLTQMDSEKPLSSEVDFSGVQ